MLLGSYGPSKFKTQKIVKFLYSLFFIFVENGDFSLKNTLDWPFLETIRFFLATFLVVPVALNWPSDFEKSLKLQFWKFRNFFLPQTVTWVGTICLPFFISFRSAVWEELRDGQTDRRTDGQTDGTAEFPGTASHFLNMHTQAQVKQMNGLFLIPNPFATLGVWLYIDVKARPAVECSTATRNELIYTKGAFSYSL